MRRKSMNLVILGATGRTGQLVVEQALAAGHNVTALVRSPERLAIRNSKLRVVAGQATDAGDVARALEGADAVISALGGSGSVISDSTRAIGDAAHKTGVKRVILLSSFLVERDRMGALSRLITGVVRGSMLKDKNDGEQLLRQSDLDWTISYPSRLTDAPATGLVKVLPEGAKRRITERISRADVAGWLVESATSRQTSHRGIDITGGARTKGAFKMNAFRVD
ncbi:MAG: NAD(P)-binding oxidoreductase [Candidatus Dormiibacterota bacterium]